MHKYFKKIIISVLLITIGFGAGWWCFRYDLFQKEVDEMQQIRFRGGYKFINPLYECEIGGEEFIRKYIPFEDNIKKRIAEEIQNDENVHIAMYFRNLNNGPSFGINQDDNFAPASLLKLPLMMAYYKKSESNLAILDQELVFAEGSDDYLRLMQQIVPGNYLQKSQAYSVSELIRRMIMYSDNEAMALLMKNFSQADLYQIYSELGVSNPYINEGNAISVKDYASFFRILYNAAYLTQADSEKALALLAQSNFRDGLVAGVPTDITVAHKFGERALAEGDYREQLHDCGVVYYEKYPYLLCIMTQGGNKEELIKTISGVSRITFEEIAKVYN